MDIKTEITTLAEAGFNKEEIIQKLRDKGYPEKEINRGYDDFLAVKRLAKWENLSLPKSVMMLGAGILLYIFLLYGDIQEAEIVFLLTIGAITAFGLAIYFFVQENNFGIAKWIVALVAGALLLGAGFLFNYDLISPILKFPGLISLALTIFFYIKKE